MKSGLALLVTVVALGWGQTDEEKKLLGHIKQKAQECARALVEENYEKFVDLIYPKIVEEAGGRKILIGFLKESVESRKRRQLRLLSYEMKMPQRVVRSKGDLFAIVPGTMRMSGPEGATTTPSFLVGISSDEGKTWKFIESNKPENAKAIRKMVPHLPTDLALPGEQLAGKDLPVKEAVKQEAEEFVYPLGNVKLSYPASWKKLREANIYIPLYLEDQGAYFFFSVMETNDSLEALMEDYVRDLKAGGEFIKEISREFRTVAGEKALFAKMEIKERGFKKNVYLTSFNHQGFYYRWIGVPNPVMASATFDKDYVGVLETIRFLREREEWLAKNEGKPVTTAFLGGLASFELNRPRWIENTFDNVQDATFLEQVHYRFFPGGGWIDVRALETIEDAQEVLDNLEITLSTRYQRVEVKHRKVKGAKGVLPALEIVGELNGHIYHFRAAAVVEEGIAVQLMLECQASQLEATQRDWEQLVRTFVLQKKSKPAEPLAYPLRRDLLNNQKSSPALDVFLSKAKPVFFSPRHNSVASISPEGNFAYLLAPEGDFLENLITRKKELVTPRSQITHPLALDRNGQRVAYLNQGQIIVQTMDNRVLLRLPGNASHFCFGPGDDDLLVCATSATNAPQLAGQPRYVTSRLERINIRDASRTTLIDFPLGRVTHPMVSPDRKSIALVTNRDYPRTATRGGHLYVCQADGSNLRQLTKDPEEIFSVAWSPDNKFLYAVRQLAMGEDGKVGVGGVPDLYRVSVQTGETVNLTRSGHIGKIWCSGPDLLVDTFGHDIPQEQQGIFRISAEELARLTTNQPVPPLTNPRLQGRKIAARVQAAVKMPIKELVPTPELMDKLARTFAEAIKEEYALNLDFSPVSLNLLPNLVDTLDLGSGREPAVILAFGAYYGETLRKVGGAQWKLKPQPFGDWVPARIPAGNPLVQVILPWSNLYRWAIHANDSYLRQAQDLHENNPKILLVYPASYAEQALREATPAAYQEAMKLVDKGDVKKALDLLAQELRRHPRPALLAREIISLCEAANLQETAQKLTHQAMEAGVEIPELLVRHADEITRSDPKKSLDYYRKATQGNLIPAEYLMKLGQQYVRLGQPALAEACWRRAYNSASNLQRQEIINFLGMDPPRNAGLSKSNNP
jgi:hypothetical protein